MSRPRALVVLNPAARGGKAARLWPRVRREVERRFEATVVETDREGEWRAELGRALRSGVRVFVAAGGDGTVHAVAEALVSARGAVPLEELALGAVGLGSSNDFHKPLGSGGGDVPLRLDAVRAAPRDVGWVRWTDASGEERGTVLLVSASVGVVAEGNARFNARRARLAPAAIAIAASALGAIAAHRDVVFLLRHDGVTERAAVSSLSVLKTPWLSGSLRYDLPVAPADGLLRVALCEGMGRLRLLGTLASLLRGRFAGRKGTRSFSTASLELGAGEPFLLEVDGEVAVATGARFDLLEGRVRACA